MKFENGIFEAEYVTSFTQTGVHNVITNKSLLSLMEKTAGAHSAYSQFTFKDLAKDNLSWVILGWKLKVFKRIRADYRIRIETWGRSANKLFVMRDFKVYNNENELCAIATSKWCLINTEKGKIAKMPENIEEIYHGFHDESVFDEDDDLPRIPEPNLVPLDVDLYRIRRFDIDINKHVHNLNYVDFAYEILPFDVYIGDELNNLEITYKKEIKYGETIKSFLYQEKQGYTIVIKSEDENIIHCVVKLY